MRRFLIPVVLALVLAAGVAGCGSESQAKSQTEPAPKPFPKELSETRTASGPAEAPLSESRQVEAGLEQSETTPAEAPATSTEYVETVPPPDPSHDSAPEIRGETLEGTRFSLEQLRGTPVFVNVWASW